MDLKTLSPGDTPVCEARLLNGIVVPFSASSPSNLSTDLVVLWAIDLKLVVYPNWLVLACDPLVCANGPVSEALDRDGSQACFVGLAVESIFSALVLIAAISAILVAPDRPSEFSVDEEEEPVKSQMI